MSGVVFPSPVLASAHSWCCAKGRVLYGQKSTFWALVHTCVHTAHKALVPSSLTWDMSWKILIINVLKIGSDLPNILLAVAMEMFSNKKYSSLPNQCSSLQRNIPLSKHSFMSLMSIRQTWPPSLLQNAELLAKNAFYNNSSPLPRLTLESDSVQVCY